MEAEMPMTAAARWIVTGAVSLALLGICSVFGAGDDHAGAGLDAGKALERLKALEGIWQSEGGTVGGDTSSAVHEFRVLAGGTIVLEIMDPEGEQEVNVYHLDGEDLLMTHYCGGGTQPTMKLKRSGGDSDTLSFVFLRATNLPDLGRRHVHTSKLILRASDRVESWYTFHKGGRETAASKFVLTRTGRSPGDPR